MESERGFGSFEEENAEHAETGATHRNWASEKTKRRKYRLVLEGRAATAKP